MALSKRSFLRRDKEGVASTVGTIMALLVFITFIALLTNSYVPAWMQDNERAHMNEVFNQMGDLKGKVDALVVNAQITGESGIEMYAPIMLGANGVPVFAAPTAGLLTYVPGGINTTGVSVYFNYLANGQSVNGSVINAGGKVEFYAPNRYYVQQWVAYENGAIVVRQNDGQVVRAFPSLELVKRINETGTTLIDIRFTQIDLQGTNVSKSGTSSVGLNIDLLYVDSEKYNLAGNDSATANWVLELNTMYGQAWNEYLVDLCNRSGLVRGVDYDIVNTTSPINPQASLVRLSIYHADVLSYNRAFLSVSMLS